MRNRFFLISFFVLTIVSVAATLIHGLILKRERLEVVDKQVREAATALLDSQLNSVRSVEFNKVEEILSEELGESRIGKFFIIRNSQGLPIFESTSAKVLLIRNIPQEPQWITIQNRGKFIRVLNLKLPRIPDRNLQVGLVIDESLISPGFFTEATLFFLVCILVLGLGVAWLLTSTLLSPLKILVETLSKISVDSQLEKLKLPNKILSLFEKSGPKDEFHQLVKSISDLILRVSRSHKISRAWSYQMAHELKTPLAIVEGEMVKAQKTHSIHEYTAKKVLSEIMRASETITSFLSWAELEGIKPSDNLYPLSIQKLLNSLRMRLEATNPSRIQISIKNDFYVLAGPLHLEHLLLNLISNALNYSSPEEKIELASAEIYSLTIIDSGSGIPKYVIDRLGEPFNKGTESKNRGKVGHGLGLAYSISICKIYDWKIDFKGNKNGGTTIEIKFPNLDIERKGS